MGREINKLVDFEPNIYRYLAMGDKPPLALTHSLANSDRLLKKIKLSMDAQLTTTEINATREILQDYAPAQEALATLETHNGRLDTAFDALWVEKNGSPPLMQDKSLWQVTLKALRNELCGNDGFRSQVKEYTKNPGSAPLLTGLIVYLVGIAGMAGLPIDPAIATVIVLYILKIGLNIFCEYTEPPAADANTQSPGK